MTWISPTRLPAPTINAVQPVQSSSTSDVGITSINFSSSTVTSHADANGSPLHTQTNCGTPSSTTKPHNSNGISPTSPISGPPATDPTPSLFRHQPLSAGLSPGVIAGVVIAALTFLLCLFLLIRRHRRRVRARLGSESDWALIPSPDNKVQTPSQDHSSHSHSYASSPERSNPITHVYAHATTTTSWHSSPTDLHPAKIPTPPGAATPMAQWEVRQHEMLMRENGEFWEEIEQLKEEIDRLRAGEEVPVAA